MEKQIMFNYKGGTMNLFTPTHVTMHHSLTKDSETVSWGAIRKWHMGLMDDSPYNMNDIGYQYGIELVNDHYEILVGRFEGQQGAHCPQKNMNRISIGICVIGNFDIQVPDLAQWNLALDLCANICTRYSIPVENVRGHRFYAPYKSCPGKQFNMNDFRADLSTII